MRFRRKFFGILTCILGVSGLIALKAPMFLAVESTGDISNKYQMLNSFDGMDTRFKALNKQFEPAFANIVGIICIMFCVLYALFLLCFLLQYFKVGAIAYRPVLRSVAVVMILLGLLAIAGGLTFIIMNKVIIKGATVLSFKWGAGLYLLAFGSIVSGLSGAISQSRY